MIKLFGVSAIVAGAAMYLAGATPASVLASVERFRHDHATVPALPDPTDGWD